MSSINGRLPGPDSKADAYVQVPHALLDSGVPLGAIGTYMAIRRTAWKVGSTHRLGQDDLVERTGTNRRTITRHLAALEQVGAITVERKGARNPDVITVCAYSEIQALCDETSMSHHPLSRWDTSVSAHNEVMGHSEQGDGTPVSHTMGHQSPIRREEDFSQDSEEEEVLEQYSHLSVANDGTAPAGGVPGGKGPGVAAGAATTPAPSNSHDPGARTAPVVHPEWASFTDGRIVVSKAIEGHPAHARLVQAIEGLTRPYGPHGTWGQVQFWAKQHAGDVAKTTDDLWKVARGEGVVA